MDQCKDVLAAKLLVHGQGIQYSIQLPLLLNEHILHQIAHWHFPAGILGPQIEPRHFWLASVLGHELGYYGGVRVHAVYREFVHEINDILVLAHGGAFPNFGIIFLNINCCHAYHVIVNYNIRTHLHMQETRTQTPTITVNK